MLNLNRYPLLMILRPILMPTFIAIVIQIVASLSSWVVYQSLVDITQGLIDKMPAESVYNSLWKFIIGLSLSSGLGAIALAITHFADANLQRTLRMQLINKLSRLPALWFNERSSGSVRQIIQNGVESLHHLVAHSLVEGVSFVMTPLVGLCFCFTLNWRLGIAACAPIILYFLIFAFLSRNNTRDIMAKISTQLAKISAVIVDYVRGVAVLKVFGRAGEGYQKFTTSSKRFHDDFSALVRPAMKAQSVAIIAISTPVVALIMVITGMWGIENSTMTAAEILIAALISMLLPASIMTVAMANQVRNTAFVAAKDIQNLLNEAELSNSKTAVTFGAGEVTLKNVGFALGEKEILSDISLTLFPDSFTAIVGPSGAGKTTLARLIARQQDVSCGQICIDGHDIRQIPLSQLYQRIGILEQTPSLPAITLAQNIALGMDNVPLYAIRKAARAALIDERIMTLPLGYDSIPGIDVHLSGGESQRIAIARLFLAACPILIMDEATSAIDPDSEIEIRQAIANLAYGRTTVVIAHRLSTIKDADQIVVLDNGRIKELGKHESLLSNNQLYAQLWREFSNVQQKEGTA